MAKIVRERGSEIRSVSHTEAGVGLVQFWPTLFFRKGDGSEAQELARLKVEHGAIEHTYNREDCARDG